MGVWKRATVTNFKILELRLENRVIELALVLGLGLVSDLMLQVRCVLGPNCLYSDEWDVKDSRPESVSRWSQYVLRPVVITEGCLRTPKDNERYQRLVASGSLR